MDLSAEVEPPPDKQLHYHWKENIPTVINLSLKRRSNHREMP